MVEGSSPSRPIDDGPVRSPGADQATARSESPRQVNEPQEQRVSDMKRVDQAEDRPRAGPEPVEDLVRRTLDGDDDAFAEIFRRYRERVYRVSFRFTRDHDDAMELTQTTFIKVHRSLGSYREESSFATWLSRVATNCGIDLDCRINELQDNSDVHVYRVGDREDAWLGKEQEALGCRSRCAGEQRASWTAPCAA